MILSDKYIIKHANLLNGFTIEKLANCLNINLLNTNIDKGIIGKLIHSWFYISFNNNSIIDLPTLGIEIKTINLNKLNLPFNNVFITHANLYTKNINLTWYNSNLRKKILKILWIPIIKNKINIHYKNLIIGKPFLWRLNSTEENIFKKDWKELINIIILGKLYDNNHILKGDFIKILRKSNKKNRLTTLSCGKKIYCCSYAFYFTKFFLQKIFYKKNII